MSLPGAVIGRIKALPKKLFGSRNDRILKRMASTPVAAIPFEDRLRSLCLQDDDYDKAFQDRYHSLSLPDPDDADAMQGHERAIQEIRLELSEPLRGYSDELSKRLADGESPDQLMPEAFAVLREASRRAQKHRHFDCQLIGGRTLYEANVAEMRTGEGKTIVCHLAAYLKVLQDMKVHVVTVNDYLVERDATFAAPIFELLGFTVGYIQAQVDPGGREGIRSQAYGCNITFGTASEFGFDYLRDNMKTVLADQVQGRLDFVIIDEVDSILIDEARTPLIISGPTQDDITRYPRANKVAQELVRRQKTWDRKVLATVAKYDGDSRNIPKLDDAMSILGYKEHKTSETDADHDAEGDAEGPATLGPDFLTDDQVEAIQIFENDILRLPAAEQYRRYHIIQHERKSASITHDGVTIAQELLDMGSLYSGANMEWPHLIENALRAHGTYERDRDYVVKDGQVIIVDPFTGRLMHGRQWSDGLHQAVESKEGVQVKEETQTLATITIQNFFKLYKQMSGMTGTAMTEADEFMKIYRLDCVEIPTNRPVNRLDHNDKMYRDAEQKYNAIVEEIHEVHRRGRPADPFLLADVLSAMRPILVKEGRDISKIDEALRQFNKADLGDRQVTSFLCETYDEVMGDLAVGRPILVGTTSVQNSEKLSRLLERRYGIEHEVLNAKNHAREAEIVTKAGAQSVPLQGKGKTPLGNVTIATNMAGRGTDIKLGSGVVYPKCKVPEQMPDGSLPSDLYPAGVTKCCLFCGEYDPQTNCAHCFKTKLDSRFPDLGRKVCSINVPCGLHIIGTERHESRRIDNQLRGRSGRQGDPGSSRFSLSLQDDLLKLFMSDWMLKMMEKLGFAEGTSLEDKRLTKGIERAQRKVEERNFSMRKHLLEWDEPMDYQRKEFYKERQRILEERDLIELIFATIDNTIATTVDQFLSGTYPQQCIAQWCHANLDLNIEEDSIDMEDVESAQQSIRRRAKDEIHDQIRTSIGEYIDPEEPASDWDVGGLLQWAKRVFNVPLTQNQMRKMEPREIEDVLIKSADDHYDNINLDGIAVFLAPDYPRHALAEWVRIKFNINVSAEDLDEKTRGEASELLDQHVRAQYRSRETSYPIESCLERAFQDASTDNAAAADHVVRWVNGKYRAGWNLDDVQGKTREELFDRITKLSKEFLEGGRFEREIEETLIRIEQELGAKPETGEPGATSEETTPVDEASDDPVRDKAIEWAKKRFGAAWNRSRFDAYDGSMKDALVEQGREMLRWELTRLEQFVLLRLYDQAWKDHLLEMDHLKNAIMQRPLGGDQTHPQSQYAIEGRELFDQMWTRIAGRVTDVIFKVRMGAGAQPARDAAATNLAHRDSTGAGFAASADQAAAMRAQGTESRTEPIRRETPKVGRNSPCPCGSGKKYKQCCGKK